MNLPLVDSREESKFIAFSCICLFFIYIYIYVYLYIYIVVAFLWGNLDNILKDALAASALWLPLALTRTFTTKIRKARAVPMSRPPLSVERTRLRVHRV